MNSTIRYRKWRALDNMNENKVMLVILDGFGHSDDKENNAIAQAKTPFYDKLKREYPNILLNASGKDVGLPAKQMGSSEVGHMNIGAGRVVLQDYLRINKDLAQGRFCSTGSIQQALNLVNPLQTVHVLALLSDGGVHSHISHIESFLQIASKTTNKVKLHAFLDGRDCPPKSAAKYIGCIEKKFPNTIASIAGRFWAMDRDNNWDRIEKYYKLITDNQSEYRYKTAMDALNAAYSRGETDEFIQPSSISNDVIRDDDIVVFLNYRADRQKQLYAALRKKDFSAFNRVKTIKANFFTLTEYAEGSECNTIYPQQSLPNNLGECIAKHNLNQLRISETEKWAHVTYFFNGGKEGAYKNEERILIPSSKVTSYAEKPAMAAYEITERIVNIIENKKYSYSLTVCNYPNADMVGHTGNLSATIKAIEILDDCLARLATSCAKAGVTLLVTADHGNAEKMFNEHSRQAHTAHTTSLVPFIVYGKNIKLSAQSGSLSDIAPTILKLLKIPIPAEMTGKALLDYM